MSFKFLWATLQLIRELYENLPDSLRIRVDHVDWITDLSLPSGSDESKKNWAKWAQACGLTLNYHFKQIEHNT